MINEIEPLKGFRAGGKKGQAQAMTGRMFLNLAMEYCKIMNSGQVPSVLSTLQQMVQAETQQFEF